MARARMLALDLGARFARLLHDQIRGVVFRNKLNARLLVPRNHDEAGDVGRDPIVLGRRELDLLDTGFIAALTVERQRFLDAVLFGTFIDPLVDRAKNLFVVCRSIRGIHWSIVPRASRSLQRVGGLS